MIMNNEQLMAFQQINEAFAKKEAELYATIEQLHQNENRLDAEVVALKEVLENNDSDDAIKSEQLFSINLAFEQKSAEIVQLQSTLGELEQQKILLQKKYEEETNTFSKKMYERELEFVTKENVLKSQILETQNTQRAQAQKNLETLIQSEREFHEQIEQLRAGAQSESQKIREEYRDEKSVLSHSFEVKERELLSQIESIRQELKEQSDSSAEYLVTLAMREKEFATKEGALNSLIIETQNTQHTEAKKHLESLAQREREFAQELKSLREQMSTQQGTLEKTHRNTLTTIGQKHKEREIYLERQMAQIRLELKQKNDTLNEHLKTLAAREQKFAHELKSLREQMSNEQATLEKTHRKMIMTLGFDTKKREDELLNRIDKLRSELNHKSEESKAYIVEREKYFVSEILKLHENTELQREKLEIKFTESIETLYADHKEREKILQAQIESMHNELKAQSEIAVGQLIVLAEREKEFASKENALNNVIIETQNNLESSVKREDEFAEQLRAVTDQKDQAALHNQNLSLLITEAQQLESKLHLELATHQQTLMELTRELDRLQGSLSWRITTPFRALKTLFIQSDDSEVASQMSSFFIDTPTKEVVMEPCEIHSEPAVCIVTDSSLSEVNPPPIDETPATSEPIENLNPSYKETIMSSSPTVVATSLDELLAYHDADFVHCAYITLLGRAPDPEGMHYYLERVRAGRAKIAIINQIVSSSEGKRNSVKITGLNQVLSRYRWGKMPIVGSVIRSITRHDDISCQIRQIENNIYLLGKDTCKRFDRIEKNIAIVTNENIKIDNKPDELNHLSSHTREIYFQLKAAALKQEFGGTK